MGGNSIRKDNLRRYLERFRKRPVAVLVGEAAGPWGARFSGIPFTSERQLSEGVLPFKGSASSTHVPPYMEKSGSVVWGELLHHFPDFFLWNAVPLHPHLPGMPLTIRRPSAREIRTFSPLLQKVLAILAPRRVVAVGRVAETSLRYIGVPGTYVRHPSQAGAKAFREGIRSLFVGMR
ncbi:MAG: uracil-DNA glycosylase [Chloroflexota bacterium]